MKDNIEDMSKEELIKHHAAATEMLALVLNETGPVEIDKNNRKPLPEGVGIVVDVNTETETVTISLEVNK